jgi:hypothetical protein
MERENARGGKKLIFFITKNYEEFAKLKIKYSLIYSVILWVFKKNAQVIYDRAGKADEILSTRISMSGSHGLKSYFYEDMYMTGLSKVNGKKLKHLIDNFISLAKNSQNSSNLSDVRLYIATFLFSGHIQRIEFLEQKCITFQNFKYIGRRSDIEFLVLSDLVKKYDGVLELLNIKYSFLLSWFTEFYSYIRGLLKLLMRKRRSQVVGIIPTSNFKNKTIVIGFSERRRIERIKEITRELISLGYEVLYYCANPKGDDAQFAITDKEFCNRLVFDLDILKEKQVTKIIKEAKKDLVSIFQELKEVPSELDFQYKKVNIFKHYREEVQKIIQHRYIESRLCYSGVDRLAKNHNVVAYIGLDTYISTLTSIRYFNLLRTPTFFYLYNPLNSDVFYHAALSFVNPSFWFVSGEFQKQKLLSMEKNLEYDENIAVIGDVPIENKYGLNRADIKRKIFKDLHIDPSKKIILLISSYIQNEFTEAVKKDFIISTYKSAIASNALVVIKPHPNESIELLSSSLKKWGVEAKLLLNESIESAVSIADVMCMNFSESAFAAFRMGVPVISVCRSDQVADFDSHWKFYTSNVVKHVELGQHFGDVISDLINVGPKRTELTDSAGLFLENSIARSDGTWAKKIACNIHERLDS